MTAGGGETLGCPTSLSPSERPCWVTGPGSPSLGWKEVGKVWSHDLYSKNIYTVYSSIYICIYIYRKSCDFVWGSHEGCVCGKGGGSEEISMEGAVNPWPPPQESPEDHEAPSPLHGALGSISHFGEGSRGKGRGGEGAGVQTLL